MSTEGISSNIVENATSDKSSIGGFKKNLGKTQEAIESQIKGQQSGSLYQVPESQAGKYKTETNGLVGILRKETIRIREYWV